MPNGQHGEQDNEDKQDNYSTTNTDYNYDTTWNVA
jgi:hypothetical protein